MRERTFLMIKPDGVKRKLVGEIIIKLEKKGLNIVALKMLLMSKTVAEKHYEEHKNKIFFQNLIKFITSGPVVAMILEGENAVDVIHKLAGSTDPKKALSGTIRGDYSLHLTENVVHTSDSFQSATKEINNFFKDK